MLVAKIRNGLLAVIALSALGLGCELIVDFDRTRIPVEGSDAAAVTDGGSDAAATDGAPAACNNLGHNGPAVVIQAALGQPPDSKGGTIAPGTYLLTQVTEYAAGDSGVTAGSTNRTLRRTAVFTNTTYTFIESTGTVLSDGGTADTTTQVVNSNFNTNGAGDAGLLGLTITCPGTGTTSHRYTATPTTVEIYGPSPTTVQTLTKLN